MRLPIALLLATCLWGASGCARSGDAAESWVELGGKRYTVEIADDDAERARGLMFRDQLASDRGMLFLFEDERPQAFWMKNTRIPLDILYFDAQRRLVSQQLGVPPCSAGDRCPSYPSDGPARYVLELNAGEASKLGLAPGAPLTFGPGIARD
ncbi:DUF192 domain-containing protein [Tolypothrix campylonemoides VB511288]|nr:DUF192 domain-containing protein [Tolypothrix campylonemoides VB511288]